MRPNMFDGVCTDCGTIVKAGEGTADKNLATNKWIIRHANGACPSPKRPTVGGEPSAEQMTQAVGKVVDLIANRMAELVPELVEANLDKLSRVAEIKVGKLPAVKIDGVAHRALEDVVTIVTAGASPYLVGPAGSGKTTLAEQVAKVTKRKFYMEARVTSEFKLIGFIDAHGNCVRTQFREAYEHGGVFLFDEVDASDADAMTAFNAALSNGRCPFPDKMVERHKDFVAIAAANTFGRGADRQYVGRNQLDAATLDRFVILEVDYDEALEMEICGNAAWAKRVQTIRKAVAEEKVRHVVSPRASIYGARLLAAGMEQSKVEEMVVWKGLDTSNRTRVEGRL